MVIQNNISALNAHRLLNNNNNELGGNLEKLSSGYRINRAADDAAGLAISETMRAQLKGLESAEKNTNDGISLVQTAEGALAEVHSMLHRMTYLATQSANGTYSDEDRSKLQAEIASMNEEIDRISDSTKFNDIELLKFGSAIPDIEVSVNTHYTYNAPDELSKLYSDSTIFTNLPSNRDITATINTYGSGEYAISLRCDGDFLTNDSDNIYTSYNGNHLQMSLDGTFGVRFILHSTSSDGLSNEDLAIMFENLKTATQSSGYPLLVEAMDNVHSITIDRTFNDWGGGNTGYMHQLSTVAPEEVESESGYEVTTEYEYIDTGKISSTKEVILQVGETNNDFQRISVPLFSTSSKSIGTNMVDIATLNGAQDAIDIIRDAIDKISDIRSSFGAIQNRLDHTINNIGVASENLQHAESRIRDADMAQEMMWYTKNNILVQSSQSMLAQANQTPQGVLQLLQ